MNKDQVKGTAKDLEGRAQRKIGAVTGDVSQQVKGAAKQVAGKIQKGVGNVRNSTARAVDNLDGKVDRDPN